MLKKIFLVSCIIFCLFIIMTFHISADTITKNISNNSVIPKELPIANLSIKKLNINKPIYKINSKNNNVSKNVELLEGSILPDNENSIIFLAAHSGNSEVSYFNNLYKLKVGDEILLQYKNNKYTYVVDNKFLEDKDGDIEINKTSNNQLVLTTCSTTDSSKQLIINSNLKK